ncbi:MAG: hypothetical protein V4564_09020 [Pseudomonadota bacterium]|uniref:hypothetical protein n=1 Tax=Sphingomonas sp. ERG5 TaxID=1381597 RepID=UPI00054B63BE|nr:hypothetical protein [Sphingomonas sp. ERG5]
MSDRLQSFINQINLAQNDWRVTVGNPYISSYTQAYANYQKVLGKQKESDKEAGELFVTAACIATGSILLASVGSVTMRLVARRTVARIATRTLSNNFQQLFRATRKNEGVIFAAGKFVDMAKGGLKKKAEKIATDHLQSVSSIISPEPLVQYLQMDSFMRANVNCAIRMAQAVEEDSSASAQEKAEAYDMLKAAPIYSSPTSRSTPSKATLAELIELTFYLSEMLETDTLVSWPASYAQAGEGGQFDNARRATSVPISQNPGARDYPRPATPRPSYTGYTPAHQSIAISRAGGDIQDRTNELCKKVFDKSIYSSTFFGMGGPADTLKPAELRQAEVFLNKLSGMLKPQNPLDAMR